MLFIYEINKIAQSPSVYHKLELCLGVQKIKADIIDFRLTLQTDENSKIKVIGVKTSLYVNELNLPFEDIHPIHFYIKPHNTILNPGSWTHLYECNMAIVPDSEVNYIVTKSNPSLFEYVEIPSFKLRAKSYKQKPKNIWDFSFGGNVPNSIEMYV